MCVVVHVCVCVFPVLSTQDTVEWVGLPCSVSDRFALQTYLADIFYKIKTKHKSALIVKKTTEDNFVIFYIKLDKNES